MAADGKINIFVQLDMNGNKSHCFRMKPDDTVSALIEAVKREEGPQVDDVTLIRAAKPMRIKNNNGTAMKLSDYNCYNDCNIFASLRLIGGAQDPNVAPAAPGGDGANMRKFDIKKVTKLGATLAYKKNSTTEYEDCPLFVGGTDSCEESAIPKARLPCGCIFCADCMNSTLDTIIKVGGGIKLTCGDTQHGDYNLDEMLLYEIAALTGLEKAEKDKILSQNYIKRVDAEMHVCFNQKCKRFIPREGGGAKVECRHCNKFNCWYCQKEWKGDELCGNDCNMVGKINQIIELGQMKTINSTKGAKQCWDTRFCPVKTCSAVNQHSSGCQKVTCQVCRTLYCHLCLGLWDKPGGCSYNQDCGKPKPKTLVSEADLPK